MSSSRRQPQQTSRSSRGEHGRSQGESRGSSTGNANLRSIDDFDPHLDTGYPHPNPQTWRRGDPPRRRKRPSGHAGDSSSVVYDDEDEDDEHRIPESKRRRSDATSSGADITDSTADVSDASTEHIEDTASVTDSSAGVVDTSDEGYDTTTATASRARPQVPARPARYPSSRSEGSGSRASQPPGRPPRPEESLDDIDDLLATFSFDDYASDYASGITSGYDSQSQTVTDDERGGTRSNASRQSEAFTTDDEEGGEGASTPKAWPHGMWLVDYDAEYHCTNQKDMVENPSMISATQLAGTVYLPIVVLNKVSSSVHRSKLEYTVKTAIRLANVIYDPHSPKSYISAKALERKGLKRERLKRAKVLVPNVQGYNVESYVVWRTDSRDDKKIELVVEEVRDLDFPGDLTPVVRTQWWAANHHRFVSRPQVFETPQSEVSRSEASTAGDDPSQASESFDTEDDSDAGPSNVSESEASAFATGDDPSQASESSDTEDDSQAGPSSVSESEASTVEQEYGAPEEGSWIITTTNAYHKTGDIDNLSDIEPRGSRGRIGNVVLRGLFPYDHKSDYDIDDFTLSLRGVVLDESLNYSIISEAKLDEAGIFRSEDDDDHELNGVYTWWDLDETVRFYTKLRSERGTREPPYHVLIRSIHDHPDAEYRDEYLSERQEVEV